jgi:hypothetical protein
MSKQLELIEEAKRRFSVGDKYHPINSQSCAVITTTTFKIERNLDDSTYYDDTDVLCNGGNIYVKGVWAPNLTIPVNKGTNESNYSII